MHYKPLPIGVDNFEKLITRGYYFVDKTLLIRELLEKKGDISLFTRPRRFGKTLNMSMLQYFLEDAREEDGTPKDNRYLFSGLKIMQAGERYLSCMGQYPVISLSLKSARHSERNFSESQKLSLSARSHTISLYLARLFSDRLSITNWWRSNSPAIWRTSRR